MQFTPFPILGMAIPEQRSQLEWILSTQGSMAAMLVLVSAAAIFGGACYLVATRRPVTVLAVYLILLPLPCIISLCGWLGGSATSLSVIAASPEISLTTADIADGLATSLMSLLIAFIASAPAYAVLAYGLLSQTLQRPTDTPRPITANLEARLSPQVSLSGPAASL